MRKVLIVDDEIWVRKGIIKNIDWDEIGLELAGEAEDGLEALAKVKELAPDILLMDMRMPGIDGKELIRKLKDFPTSTVIIIVSGYADFEYTKEAIVNRAFDYILKPVKKSELNDVLRKAVDYLNKEEERDPYRDSKTNRLELLNKFLFDRSPNIEELTEKQLEAVSDLLNASQIRVGLCRTYAGKNCDQYGQYFSDSFEQLKTLISESFVGTLINSEVFINEFKDNELVIFTYSKDDMDFFNLESVFKELVNCVKNDLKLEVNFYFGNVTDSIYKIKESYEYALRAGRKKKIGENGIVLIYEEASKELPEFYPAEKEKLIIEFLKLGNVRNALRTFEEFINSPGLNLLTIYNLQKSIILLLGSVEKLLMGLDTGFEALFNRNSMSYIYQITSCESMEEIKELMIDIIKGATDFIQESKKKNGNLVIEEITKLLNENYFNEISLNDIAQKYFMNPNYLCRLFKNKTGFNFIDYLTDIRVGKAKQLLADTEMKSYAISKMVGYEEYRYFSQVFRKRTGMTPTEYRLKNI